MAADNINLKSGRRRVALFRDNFDIAFEEYVARIECAAQFTMEEMTAGMIDTISLDEDTVMTDEEVPAKKINIPGNLVNGTGFGLLRGQNELFDMLRQNLPRFGRFRINACLRTCRETDHSESGFCVTCNRLRILQNGGFMETKEILAVIDAEIERLQRVKDLLSGSSSTRRKPGRPVTKAQGKATRFHAADLAAKPKRRTLSAAARKKIAAAQKARWAKAKAIAKKSASAKTAK